jgi:hypothetical protein
LDVLTIPITGEMSLGVPSHIDLLFKELPETLEIGAIEIIS